MQSCSIKASPSGGGIDASRANRTRWMPPRRHSLPRPPPEGPETLMPPCTQYHTHGINGQLSDDAYARLTAEKADRESYSDVVLRLTGEKDPLRFVGRLKVREDFDEVMAAMRRAEARGRRRLGT